MDGGKQNVEVGKKSHLRGKKEWRRSKTLHPGQAQIRAKAAAVSVGDVKWGMGGRSGTFHQKKRMWSRTSLRKKVTKKGEDV